LWIQDQLDIENWTGEMEMEQTSTDVEAKYEDRQDRVWEMEEENPELSPLDRRLIKEEEMDRRDRLEQLRNEE